MERVERQWDVIHLLALQIAALYGLGETAQAQQVAVRLLALTEPEGYIRVYLDAGEPMQRVLQSLLDTPDGTVSISAVSQVLAAFEQEKRRPSLTEQVRSAPPASSMALAQNSAAATQLPFEPLSPQERRVFHLLVAGRTYAEIAQELIVSLNTIKTQVSSIYRKLGVSRRVEASELAHRLNLL